MKIVFKILALILLSMTIVSCELLDPKECERARQKAVERGRKCYRNQYGNVYYEDTK